jgi:two-component system, response regulator PdtaR
VSVALETPPTAGAVARCRCLIVEDDTFLVMGLRAQLEKLGHTVVGDASRSADAQRLYAELHPDLVLMDIRLDGGDGIDVSSKLLAHRACPIIILSAFSDKELIERAAAAGVFGYLIKPVSIESLAAQIAVVIGRFTERMKLVAENQALAQSLELRKLIERAKGIVMRRLNLSEADAHKRLQQESQKRRQSMPELAKKIIESEELLGGET